MKNKEDPGLLLFIAAAMKAGASLEEAVKSLGEGTPAVLSDPWVKAAIQLSKETGGPLAPLLETAAHSLRRKKEMKDKMKALSAQSTASAWIVGLTPLGLALVMAILSPEYITPLFQSRLGILILGSAALLMMAGLWMARRMVQWDE